MEDDLSMLSAFPLFRGISPQELSQLSHSLNVKKISFAKGEYLLHSGDRVSSLGLILSGKVLILKEDFWGNRNILNSLGAGQCFGETFACVPGSVLGVSVLADSPCTVLFLNIQRILHFPGEECPCASVLIRNLLADMAGKNIAFTEKLSHLGQRSTRAKLLSYLSAQAQLHQSVEFDIPFTRQQLADYLFVERSGLSMELCRMRDEGLLEFHKNHFLLKSVKLNEA